MYCELYNIVATIRGSSVPIESFNDYEDAEFTAITLYKENPIIEKIEIHSRHGIVVVSDPDYVSSWTVIKCH